jgi:hypothetical protein
MATADPDGLGPPIRGFPKCGFVISAWIQPGRECQCRDLLVGGPTPWQVAAGSVVGAQVLGNYWLVCAE